MNGIEISPADHWFSLCVRERAGWKCERCGLVFPQESQGLTCAHFKTRSIWAVRFSPMNGVALCWTCHSYFDDIAPGEFKSFYIEKRGEAEYDALTLLLQDRDGMGKKYKVTEGEGGVARHFKSEYREMLKMRATGYTGWLDFAGWQCC